MLLICTECKKDYKGRIQNKLPFCSQSCGSKYYNRQRKQKKPLGNRTIVEKRCNFCKNKYVSYSTSKYCSMLCNIQAKKQDSQLKFEQGLLQSPAVLRQKISEQQGWNCNLCGITKWNDQKVPLVLDHIDGDSTNNFPNNLRLICPNCDAQLPTFKARNIGKGRHTRRIRYKEGKSY